MRAKTIAIPLQWSKILKSFLLVILTYTVACQTTSSKDNSGSGLSVSQNWSGDLYVEKEARSFKLKTEIFLITPRSIRVDLRTTLDLPLASIVMTQDKTDYILYRDKKYYSGKPGPHALDPVFPLSVDVNTLSQILLHKKMEGAQCEKNNPEAPGQISRCQGHAGSTAFNVAWSKWKTSGPLAGKPTKIILDLPTRRVSLKFYFNDWQRSNPDAERLLTLSVPEGFTTISTTSP